MMKQPFANLLQRKLQRHPTPIGIQSAWRDATCTVHKMQPAAGKNGVGTLLLILSSHHFDFGANHTVAVVVLFGLTFLL